MPCYQLESLNHVDPYFVQEYVVLLLVLTHSVIDNFKLLLKGLLYERRTAG